MIEVTSYKEDDFASQHTSNSGGHFGVGPGGAAGDFLTTGQLGPEFFFGVYLARQDGGATTIYDDRYSKLSAVVSCDPERVPNDLRLDSVSGDDYTVNADSLSAERITDLQAIDTANIFVQTDGTPNTVANPYSLAEQSYLVVDAASRSFAILNAPTTDPDIIDYIRTLLTLDGTVDFSIPWDDTETWYDLPQRFLATDADNIRKCL